MERKPTPGPGFSDSMAVTSSRRRRLAGDITGNLVSILDLPGQRVTLQVGKIVEMIQHLLNLLHKSRLEGSG